MSTLCVLALELDDPLQERCALTADDLSEAGLNGPTLIVDLTSGASGWSASWAGDIGTEGDLVACLQSRQWRLINLVSVRTAMADVDLTVRRVQREESLLVFLRSVYSGGATSIRASTLSLLGEVINDRMFPQDYLAHFIHERFVGIDPLLPRNPVTETNVSSTLTFTALTAGLSGIWVTDVVRDRLLAINDADPSLKRKLRMLRVGSRLSVSQQVVENAMKMTVRPGGGEMPANLFDVQPSGIDTALIDKLATEFDKKHKFSVTIHDLEELERTPVPWWKAVLHLLVELPHYLGVAVREEFRERVAKFLRPFKKKLNSAVYGEDGRFVVEGAEYSDSGRKWRAFAEKLKADLSTVGRIEPVPTPETWTDLMAVSFAMLDGGEYPDGISPPMKEKRVVFYDPRAVGPVLVGDTFHLTPEECSSLEIDRAWARSVSAVDSLVAAEMEEVVGNAIRKLELRRAVEAGIEKYGAAAATPAEEEPPRVRGALAERRRERLIEKEAAEVAARTSSGHSARSLEEMESSFKDWVKVRSSLEKTGLLMRLLDRLERSIETATAAEKVVDLEKAIEEFIEKSLVPKGKRSRFARLLLILLLPLLIVGFLVSSVFGLVLTIIGVPLMLFLGIAWLTSFGFTLSQRIIRRAFALRRWEMGQRNEATEFERRHKAAVRAENELLRLRSLRMQIIDWQAVIRAIVHEPYGPVTDAISAATRLSPDSQPPQFVLAEFDQSVQQEQDYRTEVHKFIKIRGYLDAIETNLYEEWRTRYKAAGLDALLPQSDASPSGRGPGLVLKGRAYLNPRQDYTHSVVNEDLRSEVLKSRLAKLKHDFRTKTLESVFSKVSPITAHEAFARVTPRDFLDDLGRQEVQDFDPAVFNPAVPAQLGDNVSLMSHNIDQSLSYRPPRGIQVEDDLIIDEERLVLGVTRVDVSVLLKPAYFRCYRDESGSAHVAPTTVDTSWKID